MLFSMHEFPEFHSFDHQFNFDSNFQHCKNKSGQKIIAIPQLKKGRKPFEIYLQFGLDFMQFYIGQNKGFWHFVQP